MHLVVTKKIILFLVDQNVQIKIPNVCARGITCHETKVGGSVWRRFKIRQDEKQCFHAMGGASRFILRSVAGGYTVFFSIFPHLLNRWLVYSWFGHRDEGWYQAPLLKERVRWYWRYQRQAFVFYFRSLAMVMMMITNPSFSRSIEWHQYTTRHDLVLVPWVIVRFCANWHEAWCKYSFQLIGLIWFGSVQFSLNNATSKVFNDDLSFL